MKQITKSQYLEQLAQWTTYHMKNHGCSREDAQEWAKWNVLNPPGPAGSKCDQVEVIDD